MQHVLKIYMVGFQQVSLGKLEFVLFFWGSLRFMLDALSISNFGSSDVQSESQKGGRKPVQVHLEERNKIYRPAPLICHISQSRCNACSNSYENL